jgi:hypothetical protein
MTERRIKSSNYKELRAIILRDIYGIFKDSKLRELERNLISMSKKLRIKNNLLAISENNRFQLERQNRELQYEEKMTELNNYRHTQQSIVDGNIYAEQTRQHGLTERKKIDTNISAYIERTKQNGESHREETKQNGLTCRAIIKAKSEVDKADGDIAKLKLEHEHETKQYELKNSKRNTPTTTNQSLKTSIPSLNNNHIYITGTSGSGKSEVIKTLINYHAHKENKASLVVIDPHGKLVNEVKGFIKEKSRIIHISTENDITINPFDIPKIIADSVGGYDAYNDVLTDSICNLLSVADHATKLRAVISGVITYLLDTPDSSFGTFEKILDNRDNYDIKAVLRADPTTVEAVLLKLTNTTSTRSFPRIFSDSPTTDILEGIKKSEIILVDLQGFKNGDSIGRMIQGIMFAYALAHKTEECTNDIRLFTDESKKYLGKEAAQIITEARKFGLFYTFIVQNTSQIPKGILEVIENQQVLIECSKNLITEIYTTTLKRGDTEPVQASIDQDTIDNNGSTTGLSQPTTKAGAL